MEINFINTDFDNDLNLSNDIEDLNLKIKNICENLPALNIVKDDTLLNLTIDNVDLFKKNKKNS